MADAEPMQVEQPGEPMEIENKKTVEGPYKLLAETRSQYKTVPTAEVNIFGLVTMSAPEYEEEKRSGIDCVCVLDVSGSMKGQKISLVRKAMRRLVRCMSQKDRVCFVTFDSTVHTLMEFTKMDATGLETARKHIHALQPGSSTNLAGGLVTGIEKMKDLFLNCNANDVTSILLFTDGEANVGERSVEGILREALAATESVQNLEVRKWSPEEVGAWLDRVRLPYKEQFLEMQVDGQMLLGDLNDNVLKNNLNVTDLHMPKFGREIAKLKESTSKQGEASPHFSVTVNTFGFGASHNNQLLDKIAESFDGMYYYMENEESIVSGFANCLGGMMTTVAQEITYTVKPALNVTNLKVHNDTKITTNSDGSIQVVLGDLQAEESQDLVLSCDLPKVEEPVESFQFFSCQVLYRNLVTENQTCEELMGVVDRVGDSLGEVDLKVDTERNRILATTAIEEAKKFGDKKQLAQAREIINGALKELSNSPSANSPFITSLIQDLKTCLEGLQDVRQYRSKGKGYMQQNARCHKKKRAANFQSKEYRSQDAYQTKARRKKQAEFIVKDDSDSDDDEQLDAMPNTRSRMQRQSKKKKKMKPSRTSRPMDPSGPPQTNSMPVASAFSNFFPSIFGSNAPPAPPMQQQTQIPFPVQQQTQIPFPVQQQQNIIPLPVQQQQNIIPLPVQQQQNIIPLPVQQNQVPLQGPPHPTQQNSNARI